LNFFGLDAKKTKEMVKEIADKMDACDCLYLLDLATACKASHRAIGEVLRKLERLPDMKEIPVQGEKGGMCQIVGLLRRVKLIASFTSCALSG
jgi:hypothetical protein